MGHLEPNLLGRDIGQAACIANGIDFGNGIRARVWDPVIICGRKIGDRKITMLVPHRRAEGKLDVDDGGRGKRERAQFLGICRSQ